MIGLGYILDKMMAEGNDMVRSTWPFPPKNMDCLGPGKIKQAQWSLKARTWGIWSKATQKYRKWRQQLQVCKYDVGKTWGMRVCYLRNLVLELIVGGWSVVQWTCAEIESRNCPQPVGCWEESTAMATIKKIHENTQNHKSKVHRSQ